MGGSSSKTKSDIMTSSVNDVIVTSMQNCSSSSSISQIISVKGQGNVLSNVEMKQVFTSMMTCVNKTDWMADLQTKIENKIKEVASAQSVAVLGALGNSSADIDSKISSSVRNAINVTSMTNLINNVQQKQEISVEGQGNTLLNISMSQINNNIASSTQDLVGSISVLNDINNKLTQDANATQQDPIANLLKGLSDLLTGPMMWIAIMVVGGLIAFVMFANSSAGQMLVSEGINQMDNNSNNYINSPSVASSIGSSVSSPVVKAPIQPIVTQPIPIQPAPIPIPTQPIVTQPAPTPAPIPTPIQPIDKEPIKMFDDKLPDDIVKLVENPNDKLEKSSIVEKKPEESEFKLSNNSIPTENITIRNVTQEDLKSLPQLI